MKKELVTCDRCGDEIKNKVERKIILRQVDFKTQKEFDLCYKCEEDFERFMEGRTLLNTFMKDLKRKKF